MTEPLRRPSLTPQTGVDVVRRRVSDALPILDRAGYRSVRWLYNNADVTGMDKYLPYMVSRMDQNVERGVVTSTDTQVTLTLVAAIPGMCEIDGVCSPESGSDENPQTA